MIKLLSAILSLASAIANYLKDKQLMDAGEAKAILKGLNDADKAIAKANVARANANKLPDHTDDRSKRR